jgi:hypothetical protein
VSKRFPYVNMHLLSPEMVNWELETYFELMTLAVKLGLAPKNVRIHQPWPIIDTCLMICTQWSAGVFYLVVLVKSCKHH